MRSYPTTMPNKSKPNTRCAIYARSATSRCATSVADQVKRCRDFARQHGFAVPDEHVYTDQEASGLSIESRPALARLLTASERTRPFRCVLVVSVDRLSRHL